MNQLTPQVLERLAAAQEELASGWEFPSSVLAICGDSGTKLGTITRTERLARVSWAKKNLKKVLADSIVADIEGKLRPPPIVSIVIPSLDY